MATCRSCDARVVWVATTSGKTMPLDADTDVSWDRPLQVADGNVAPTGRNVPGRYGPVMEVRVVDAGAGKYRSHFATCPNASGHRR